MSDTEDEYEQMLVKALQLALEEDQEERDEKHKQIESRKKLVPKTRRSMSKESEKRITEQQVSSKLNENQAEEHSKDATKLNKTPNAGNVRDEVGTNEDACGKACNDETHSDEDMNQDDENQNHSLSTSDNESTQHPIFTTPFAVPAGNLQTLKLLWTANGTAKAEMADVPDGILPEQKET